MPNSRMPPTTRGAFFLTTIKPITQAEPCFMVELSVWSRIGSRESQKEHYRVRWYGPAAGNWWREHASHLREGSALALVLRDPFSVNGNRSETHAVVVHCELYTEPPPAFLRDEWAMRAQASAASISDFNRREFL